MDSTSQASPGRRMPFRLARLRATEAPATAANPTMPRSGRVTRSATVLRSAPKGNKRAAAPLYGVPSRRSKRQRHQATSDDELIHPAITPTKATHSRKALTNSAIRSRGSTVNKLPEKSPTTLSQKARVQITVPDQEPAPEFVPAWTTLPYFTLRQIFEFVAEGTRSLHTAKWLLETSRVCKAFTEPALSVLYRSPPLLSPAMAHGLIDLLSQSPDQTSFNYRQKVRTLDINVDVLSRMSRTHKGSRPLDWKALLQNVPRLSEIHFWHDTDRAPYRELSKPIRWVYPLELFFALGIEATDETPVPYLRSWTWNRRMMEIMVKRFPSQPDLVTPIHQGPAFRSLEKLTFINFYNPNPPSNPNDWEELERPFVTQMTMSIGVLHHLKHLVVESASLVDSGEFLSNLPKTIQHLELINCRSVTAEDLAQYLLTHGSELRHLTLHHNRSLSLGFLPVLGVGCPQLESLSMNLIYFSQNASYDDNQPEYTELLSPSQIPTWPKTLQYLELKNLRRWNESASENFFKSLVDSAPDLPMLRHLEIKAMLDIPIRRRSEFRDIWTNSLEQVFLRKYSDPEPHRSLRPRPDGYLPPAGEIEIKSPKNGQQLGRKQSSPKTPSPRRSGRIATLPSSSSSRASSVGREGMARPFYAEPDTDDDIGDDGSNGDGGNDDGKGNDCVHGPLQFVQGKCDVVDVRFDNQKPVEHQWSMDDFLDSESDDLSDADWNGDDDSDHGYAW